MAGGFDDNAGRVECGQEKFAAPPVERDSFSAGGSSSYSARMGSEEQGWTIPASASFVMKNGRLSWLRYAETMILVSNTTRIIWPGS
jgi:hypothetical protein